MTTQQIEDRIRYFLGADTTDPGVSQSDLYAILNDCYFEYWARYTRAWSVTASVSSGLSHFLMGSGDTAQWADCEGLEAWDGSTTDPDTLLAVYRPLKRFTEGQILSSIRSVGKTGPPENYSLSLKSRSLSASTSVFNVRVYPIPDGLYHYRARVRFWPSDLEQVGDVPEHMDEVQDEQLVLWTAYRIGVMRGYPERVLKRIAALLPPRLAAEMDLQDDRDWPLGPSRGIGQLDREVA